MARSFALGLVMLALAGGNAAAQDRSAWVDPCEEYALYHQLGDGNLFEPIYEAVCAGLGAQRMSRDCVSYWSAEFDRRAGKVTLSGSLIESYAERCEASMPGGTALQTCAEGAPCAGLPVPAAAPCGGEGEALCLEPDVLPDDGCGTGLECVVDQTPELPCGGEGEPDCDTGIVADDEPEDCGPGVECVVTQVPEPPCGGEGEPACPAPAAPTDALDLAFWQSIDGSDDPALYRAYLDRFPGGVFRPIAEARLAALGANSAPPDDPQALVAQANAIIDGIYQLDPAQWSDAAQPALPLYRRAAEAGNPAALFALGELTELGIGLPVDNGAAIGLFVRAGQAGLAAGWERALMLLGQIGDNTGFVTTFLDAYRADPATALAAFDSTAPVAQVWMQDFLRAKRYYSGPVDGAFGPASRAALDAYLTGAAPPVTATPAADLATALQRELQRVGCYNGTIDGKWGPGSAQAMRNFNHWGGASAATDRPTEAGLAAVRATPGLVCGVD